MDEVEVKSLEDDTKDMDKPESQEEEKGDGEDLVDDEENFAQRLAEMEEEAKMLHELQNQVDHQISLNVDKEEVDYSCTDPKELEAHFAACGTILRVTIMCDKWTGHPKGFAYVEFMDKSSIANAVELNESIFKGRPLKVTPKRTNLPSFLLRGKGVAGARGGGRRPRGRRPARRRAYYNPYY